MPANVRLAPWPRATWPGTVEYGFLTVEHAVRERAWSLDQGTVAWAAECLWRLREAPSRRRFPYQMGSIGSHEFWPVEQPMIETGSNRHGWG